MARTHEDDLPQWVIDKAKRDLDELMSSLGDRGVKVAASSLADRIAKAVTDAATDSHHDPNGAVVIEIYESEITAAVRRALAETTPRNES